MSLVDIAFIGSGAASTTTLIELMERLLERKAGPELTITVIDKYPEFGKGIPYGSRSSVNSLTITPIADFISTGKERQLFFGWFTGNLDGILRDYAAAGGLAAERWIAENTNDLQQQAWDKIYLPRYIFGIYMQQKFMRLRELTGEKHAANIAFIHAEATDVSHLPDGHYDITFKNEQGDQSGLTTKKLVIATGSAPVKNYGGEGSYTYINDVYEPSIEQNFDTMVARLERVEDPQQRNVLLIGSNASSIEFLYLLSNKPEVKNLTNNIVSISRKGCMPHHIAEMPLPAYPCPNLEKLQADGGYDIHTLVAAAKKDINQSINNGTVIVPYVDRIVGFTIQLMEPLGPEARKIFFGTYGMQLTRLIRRSGPAYKNASETLLHDGKLVLLKGEFAGIIPDGDQNILKYGDPDTGAIRQFDQPFNVVINCTGSDDLDNSTSPLLYNLVKKGLCAVNLSGKGFLVNERFEASQGLYIIGPLLGGNMNKTIYFWHIENLARLLYLAPILADYLLAE